MSQTRAKQTELSDVDMLRRKANALRDDGMYDVRITDWEKVGQSVKVFFETPTGDEEDVLMDWPDKPTSDNEFVKFCMNVLGQDDPQDAVMTADSLQQPVEQEYTVRADIVDGDWEIKPEWRDSVADEIEEENANDLEPTQKLTGVIFGPLTIIATILASMMDEPGVWFSEEESSRDVFWIAQYHFYGFVGTVLYFLLAGYLLL